MVVKALLPGRATGAAATLSRPDPGEPGRRPDTWEALLLAAVGRSCRSHRCRTGCDGGASGNQVYCAVISPFTTPGTQSAVNFNHYSLLRTTEEILGVPLLGGAASATSMRAAFGL